MQGSFVSVQAVVVSQHVFVTGLDSVQGIGSGHTVSLQAGADVSSLQQSVFSVSLQHGSVVIGSPI